MDGDEVVGDVGGERGEGHVAGEPGGVDHQVHPSGDPLLRRGEPAGVGEVGHQRLHPDSRGGPDLGRQRLQPLLAAGDGDQVPPRLRKLDSVGPAQPRRGAGDQRQGPRSRFVHDPLPLSVGGAACGGEPRPDFVSSGMVPAPGPVPLRP